MNRTSSSLPWCSCSTCKVHVDSCKESSFVWKRWREGGKKTKEKCVKGIFRRAPELQLCSSGKSSHQNGSKITMESNPFSEFFERCSLSLLLSRRDMGKWICLCVCVCAQSRVSKQFSRVVLGKIFLFLSHIHSVGYEFSDGSDRRRSFSPVHIWSPVKEFSFCTVWVWRSFVFFGSAFWSGLEKKLKERIPVNNNRKWKVSIVVLWKTRIFILSHFRLSFCLEERKEKLEKSLFPHRIIQYNFYAHTNTGSESLLAAHSWENEENKKAKKRCVYKFSWWKKGK